MSSLVRERHILKPAQLNALARDLLEGSFAQVWVEGEISNFACPASGHAYFTLKDERAQIRCAMFKPKMQRVRFQPRDGMVVLARGRVTLYEARGDYQLAIDHLEEAGEGALRRALEELKSRLAAEGLFDSARKRALPPFVHRLGLITSPHGAAVRDVLSVLARRFPLIEVDVLPVPVQGDGAAAQIRDMLVRAAASARYDALLLTRGGGSLEDLWAFNDEALARAIAASAVPVVSAIGHEIDTSLSDLAADLRAATPSAAAELLVPDREALTAHLRQTRNHLARIWQRQLSERAQRSDRAQLRLQAVRPALRLSQAKSQLQSQQQRLLHATTRRLGTDNEKLGRLAQRLERAHPRQRLDAARHRLAQLGQRQQHALSRHLQQCSYRLGSAARSLESISPLATLARGYSLIQSRDGCIIRSPAQVNAGDLVQARLAHGQLQLRVESDDLPE